MRSLSVSSLPELAFSSGSTSPYSDTESIPPEFIFPTDQAAVRPTPNPRDLKSSLNDPCCPLLYLTQDTDSSNSSPLVPPITGSPFSNGERSQNETTQLSLDTPSLLISPSSENAHSFTLCIDELEPPASSPHASVFSNPQYNRAAVIHSSRFPDGHQLNKTFVELYSLEDELGSGGYGFVMTAKHRTEGHEVAVKFIIKEKVPPHAWMEDEVIGRLPTEVMLLCYVKHPNIVECLDLFEDSLYFYLVGFYSNRLFCTRLNLIPFQVQELHGSPWSHSEDHSHYLAPPTSPAPSSLSTPELSPSTSMESFKLDSPVVSPDFASPSTTDAGKKKTAMPSRPHYTRRPSHDLFECIEQSENKRLSEDQARYVFSQVVDAVSYLHSLGISHRDIKDENLVIDSELRVSPLERTNIRKTNILLR
jgi:hypothetical protein